MNVDLTPEQIITVITGLGLVAEFSHKPALVQHLSTDGREQLVNYFGRLECMPLSELQHLIRSVVAQAVR